jgi:hypothetical protein
MMTLLHFLERLATPISAYSTLILVFVTGYYAYKTSKILEESRRSRQAGERQASAAEESIRLLREQIEEKAGLDKTIVASAMQTAIRNIEYWQSANVYNMGATYSIPQNIQILPDNAHSAVEHSRRISVEGSGQLTSAFDHLRHAETEIQIFSRYSARVSELLLAKCHSMRGSLVLTRTQRATCWASGSASA